MLMMRAPGPGLGRLMLTMRVLWLGREIKMLADNVKLRVHIPPHDCDRIHHTLALRWQEEHRHRRTAQLTEARQLREQQDREYEEALFQDQLAAVRRAEGEESQASPAADAVAQEEAAGEEERRAKQRAAEEAAAAAEAEEEARRKQRGAEILAIPEPATGAEPTARIRLQLPSGERLQRNFRADQCLEEVYDWAHCCRPQAKPKRFELCISFPARTLTERSATLQELDLVPSAALVLREAES
ncbi:Ubxn2b [Symbiodinium sp. CCMP2456]|nr:Ubxn2b [Symbiodinium sp. CCMP2456]